MAEGGAGRSASPAAVRASTFLERLATPRPALPARSAGLVRRSTWMCLWPALPLASSAGANGGVKEFTERHAKLCYHFNMAGTWPGLQPPGRD